MVVASEVAVAVLSESESSTVNLCDCARMPEFCGSSEMKLNW